MALQLYMVGLTVRDMDRAREFSTRLGVAVPGEEAGNVHVEVKMRADWTFFLDTRHIPPDESAHDLPAVEPRVIFEFYLPARDEVDTKYATMVGYGYRSYRGPFTTDFGMYFALILDPDDNLVLLSADA